MNEFRPTVREAIQNGFQPDQYNIVRPALSAESIGRINIVKSVFDEKAMSEPQRIVTAAPVRQLMQSVSQPVSQPSTQHASVPQPVKAAPKKDLPLPYFQVRLAKGQKISLDLQNTGCSRLRVCFGWNIKDERCDVDASAFPITQTGKVISDDWFVFYGQTASPDRSVIFMEDGKADREIIRVDLERLNPQVSKIVFVVTINEAFENHLNFSMLRDAYIRILNDQTGREIVSYQLDEYYDNVTSMTMGQLYLHNGQWKFNPVGSGVHMDLAGQCAVYGVEIC